MKPIVVAFSGKQNWEAFKYVHLPHCWNDFLKISMCCKIKKQVIFQNIEYTTNNFSPSISNIFTLWLLFKLKIKTQYIPNIVFSLKETGTFDLDVDCR